MSRPLLLRLHRWITLVFALPLAVVLVTGLILSFEPMVAGRSPGTVTAVQLDALLARHDPASQARGLFLRPYDGSLTLSGVRDAPLTVDLSTGTARPGPGPVAALFGSSRGLHEHLIFDLGWLVTASTIAMLVLVGLGIALGWPRLSNSLSGWHKGVAWVLLPLLILSPLTGLALAFGITLSGPPPATGPAVPLREAVRMVAAAHDPSALLWVRQRGRAQLARVDVGGEHMIFAVGRDGLVPAGRNWPRLLHEGNWSGTLSALINVATSIAAVALLVTGLVLWARRQLRRRQRPRSPAPVSA